MTPTPIAFPRSPGPRRCVRRGHASGIPWRKGLPLLAFALLLAARVSAQALDFGETYVHGDCLHISAETYAGRQGDFDNHDWVGMRVTNRCPFPIKHLEVLLALIDGTGVAYGERVWLLGRGSYLPPGNSYRERFAVPDPDNRNAVRWVVRVLRVTRVGPPPAKPKKAGGGKKPKHKSGKKGKK